MIKIKNVTAFFISLRTTIWMVVLLIVFMFAGAFVMPAREEFRTIHFLPLFQWMMEQPLSVTWWLWISIFIIVIIVLNTLFCSIDSLIKKRKATQWLLLISPQIIHIGFLFILFAHFLDAFGSYKEMIPASGGAVLKITAHETVKVKDIRTRVVSGYLYDWEVDIEYYRKGIMYNSDVIRPNKPSIHTGFNLIVKDIRMYPAEAVLLQVSREPGAVWALIGGILFMAGTLILIVLKVRIEK